MKNKIKGLLVLLILYIVFTSILFLVPNKCLTSFYISFAFTTVAFLLQIIIWNIGFKKGESLDKAFLGIPIVYIGTIYLIIQLGSSIVFRFVDSPYWVSLLVSIVIIGIFSITMISSQIARNEASRVEEKNKLKVDFIRFTQLDVEMIMNNENDEKTKARLKELIEKIKYSDPMSNEQIKPIEDKITEKITELKESESKETVIDAINMLLIERNNKLKIMK